MENLQILQNKAAKLILNLPLHESATQALKTLGWCRLSQRRTFQRYLFMRKALQGSIDSDFGFRPNS